MSALEDDIARVAALRGRQASEFTPDLRRYVRRESFLRMFTLTDEPGRDQRMFDRLPQASRDFIRECPLAINTIWWRECLAEAGSEDHMIAIARQRLPAILRLFLKGNYPGHPNEGKYPEP